MNLIRRLISSHCLFYRVTGLYCPGCGGKRSVYLLFHGPPLLSLWYHPLVLYGIGVLLYYSICLGRRLLSRSSTEKPIATWPLWGAVILLAGNVLLKNILLVAFHITPLSSHIY